MVTVRTATRADAPAVARILSEAFRDDPAWSITLPDEDTRAVRLTAYYLRRARRHPEQVDVAEDDGRLLGALLWEPPSGRGVLATGRRMLARTLPGLTARLPLSAGTRHALRIEAHRPAEPHWYLRDIGTAPEARGGGVGSALLEHRLGLIDRSPTPLVFLESTTPGSRRL